MTKPRDSATASEVPRGPAAWRAYAFAEFGKAGAAALYHWVFAQDAQYGEVRLSQLSAAPQLSFWTDLWLSRYFPIGTPTKILAVVNSQPDKLEVLAVEETSGAVAILIANRSIANATDNNGEGSQIRVTLDLTALPAFREAKEIELNARTPLPNGPAEKELNPGSRLAVELSGYGSTLLRLR